MHASDIGWVVFWVHPLWSGVFPDNPKSPFVLICVVMGEGWGGALEEEENGQLCRQNEESKLGTSCTTFHLLGGRCLLPPHFPPPPPNPRICREQIWEGAACVHAHPPNHSPTHTHTHRIDPNSLLIDHVMMADCSPPSPRLYITKLPSGIDLEKKIATAREMMQSQPVLVTTRATPTAAQPLVAIGGGAEVWGCIRLL